MVGREDNQVGCTPARGKVVTAKLETDDDIGSDVSADGAALASHLAERGHAPHKWLQPSPTSPREV